MSGEIAFGSGADGARGALFAIAGTMITVIGVVFSLTNVVLQAAAAQFTPRVVRTFTGDRGTQIVLGVFLGTFAYSLLVPRTIRSPSDQEITGAFVPDTAVAVAILLALVRVGFLIYDIDHLARSVQDVGILKRITHDTLVLIEEEAAALAAHQQLHILAWHAQAEPGATVGSTGDGYLQAVDRGLLLALAEER